MKKTIKINENKIRKMIREAIEGYNNDPVKRLSMLLSKFTYEEINTNYGSENNWEDICEAITDLHEYAEAKDQFDKNNIGTQYRQAVSQGKGDEFYESISSDYSIVLDDYLNNIDEWDKFMPTASEVEQMAEYFIDWLRQTMEEEIYDYRKIKMGELEKCDLILRKKYVI